MAQGEGVGEKMTMCDMGRGICILFITSTRLGIFLIKLWSSVPSFNIIILIPIYLKFETSSHAQITITYYYILFRLSLYDMKLKLKLEIFFDIWNWSMFSSTYSSNFFQKMYSDLQIVDCVFAKLITS